MAQNPSKFAALWVLSRQGLQVSNMNCLLIDYRARGDYSSGKRHPTLPNRAHCRDWAVASE